MSIHENGDAAPKVAPLDRGSSLMEIGSPVMPGPMSMAPPFAGHGGAPAQDVIKGGMDKSWFFHSLRRRWLLTTSMSLLLGAATAAALYLLFPESFAATAQYKVESTPLTLLDNNSANQTRDFDIFKSTQIAYIYSPFVLNAALREPGVSNLSMFGGVAENEKPEWLRNELVVSYPNDGEILTISMSGDYPEEHLKKVVEAVSKAYWEEVVFNERGQRQKPLQILKQSYGKLSEQISEELRAYQTLAEDAGTSAAYEDGVDPETSLMISQVRQLQDRKALLEAQAIDTAVEYRTLEQNLNDPDYQKSMVQERLAEDMTYQQLQQEMMMLDQQVRMLQAVSKRGASVSVRRMVAQRDQLQEQLSQYVAQYEARYTSEQGNEPDPMLKAATNAYQIKQGAIGQNLQQMETQMTELREKLLEKAKNNTDLMVRLAKIDQLRMVEQGIAQKIQNLQVELQAPERIQPIGAASTGAAVAETQETRNTVTRLAITGLGGLGSTLLTCLGIGYMEFRGRRLNGPDQVEEGLGLRVIGTLPSLSGRKALNPRHPVVAQLNESIDSVRTALMHESTTKRRRLILITSPAMGEGRTTVASQLAASLARAGRRTLLIDGDLRSPSLHALFNLPLEDGLCEVLRAETEVGDVIRATQAEGLWVMTAGYCDGDAVRALATDQAQPIFDKLRADYDFIIIDGPPALGVSDALLFGQHCDGAILSVLRDHSNVPLIHKAASVLKSVGIRMIGSVVNGVAHKTDRRVTHLQQVTPRSERKQLEAAKS